MPHAEKAPDRGGCPWLMAAQLIPPRSLPQSGFPNPTCPGATQYTGIAHTVVEICQDLIGDEPSVESWADCLTPILATLTDRPELHEIELHGSRVI